MAKGKSSKKNPVNALLKEASKNWKEAQQVHEDKFGENKIESGIYEAKMIEAELGVVADKLVAKVAWEIVGGEFDGRKVYENTLWLHTPGSQAWFIAWLKRLDCELEDIADAEDILEQMVKNQIAAKIDVQEQENSTYINSTVVEAIELEDDDDEDDDDDDSEDIEDMDKKELKAFIKENDLDIKVKKSMSEDDIREAIEAAMSDDDDEEDESDDEEENDSDDSNDEVDLEDMSKKELKALIKEEGLKIKGVKGMDKDELIEAIMASQEEDDDGEEEEEDTFELTEKAFLKFCKNQGIEPKKKDKKNQETMVDFISNFEYDEDDLKRGDEALLESLGLTELISE